MLRVQAAASRSSSASASASISIGLQPVGDRLGRLQPVAGDEQDDAVVRAEHRRAATASRSAPSVTPAAVSPKTPAVSASSAMFSPTSSSGIGVDGAAGRLRGRDGEVAVGGAADRERPRDRVGTHRRRPARPRAKAVATGAQPSAWPPMSRGGSPSTSPSSSSSAKPWWSFVYSEPEAIGATTTSGSSQPSCSAISYASVFEPSA